MQHDTNVCIRIRSVLTTYAHHFKGAHPPPMTNHLEAAHLSSFFSACLQPLVVAEAQQNSMEMLSSSQYNTLRGRFSGSPVSVFSRVIKAHADIVVMQQGNPDSQLGNTSMHADSLMSFSCQLYIFVNCIGTCIRIITGQ